MYLVPFVLFFFFYFSFLGGKVILHVGGVRDSSSSGQSLTYISILEASINFEGGCKGLAVIRRYNLLL